MLEIESATPHRRIGLYKRPYQGDSKASVFRRPVYDDLAEQTSSVEIDPTQLLADEKFTRVGCPRDGLPGVLGVPEPTVLGHHALPDQLRAELALPDLQPGQAGPASGPDLRPFLQVRKWPRLRDPLPGRYPLQCPRAGVRLAAPCLLRPEH